MRGLRAMLGLGLGAMLVFACSSTEDPEEQRVPAVFELCGDGVDNDDNGLIDCDDPGCVGEPACTCGDGTCDLDAGEDATCLVDCPLSCGNDTCDEGEDFVICPADCANGCGDGECTADEEGNCPADCDTACYPSDTLLDGNNLEDACRDCVVSSCPCEIEDAENAIGQTATQMAVEVAYACWATSCTTECTYAVCDSGLSLLYDAPFATCMGTSCCPEVTTCAGDPFCAACFDGSGPCMPTTPEIDALNACAMTNMCL